MSSAEDKIKLSKILDNVILKSRIKMQRENQRLEGNLHLVEKKDGWCTAISRTHDY